MIVMVRESLDFYYLCAETKDSNLNGRSPSAHFTRRDKI